jgi:hydrogenase expression/formation protein HypD
MKYIDEFRDKELVMKLAGLIRKEAKRDYRFMEVCGGHTAAIHRFGIPSLLPGNITLISGPGCPVCVTGTGFIDRAIACSAEERVIIATFGDLLRVPGSVSSLEKARSAGADIRIVHSGTEALELAGTNRERRIIFLAIGFETTAPGTAVTIRQAGQENAGNFFLLCAHKVMPPAIETIISDGTTVDGFICPGHVAAITGSSVFGFIADKYGLGCVIAGFEPVDLLMSVLMLVRQANDLSPRLEVQYSRVVTSAGNTVALGHLSAVFETCDSAWRGLGVIPQSGLMLKKEYERFNAELTIPVTVAAREENGFCICGKILRGLLTPADCPLFRDICTPENPLGSCMVSGEGSCNAWYKYKAGR